jgi:OOP family OmpA-OmpF porin
MIGEGVSLADVVSGPGLRCSAGVSMSMGWLLTGALVAVAAAGCGRTIRFDTEAAPPPPAEKKPIDPGPGYRPDDAPPPPELAGLPLTGAQIDVLGDIEFDTNSATIPETPRNVGLLETLVTAGRAYPQITKLRVEGHTDSDGDDASNQALSERRAQAVVEWLVARGVERHRLLAVGCGERDPLLPNTTAENKRSNRRTEFDIEEVNGHRFARATEHCAPNTYRRRGVVDAAGWDSTRVSFAVEKSNYAPQERVNVKFSQPMLAPEGQQYWITIVQASATDDTLGNWHYVPRGATFDALVAYVPADGDELEIRLHDLYPKHPYRVLQRTRITVKR